jgi:aspartyl-tRNA(Asn)/glutamyl-tRNA(Gln) amidotransferase subunit B
MNYSIIIGLEIHVQAKTRSKMFCRCDAKYFNAPPNSHVCPVCLGLPGALPVPNKVAIDKCVKLGLALNCEIIAESKFDRKNYFYPDLPKGYQISQFDVPFAKNGFLEFDLKDDSRRIRITRVHMEEDTGKSIHEGLTTFLDFNKSGVPLIEIVTEPDFTDIKEVTAFSKRLKQIVKYLDISDADMEKGQMRFELNMSLKKDGEAGLPKYKVEVKNIGSISVLEKVIESEYVRQKEILDKGENPVQETRGLKDMTGKTVSQRVKENSDDYRYFPEPDIPPIEFTKDRLEEIRSEIVELPQQKKHRYLMDYKLESNIAETIITTKIKADWFEQAIKGVNEIKIIQEISKWFVGDLYALMKADKLKFKDLKLKPEYLAQLLTMLFEKKLSGSLAKQVLLEMYKTNKAPELIVKEKGLEIISDTGALSEIAKKVIANNEKVVKDISKNPNAIKFLVGQIMRETRGKADPNLAEAEIRKILGV